MDGVRGNVKQDVFFGLPSYQRIHNKKPSAVFFSRKGIISEFYTQDSGLYSTSLRQSRFRKVESVRKIDGLRTRRVQSNSLYEFKDADLLSSRIQQKYSGPSNYLSDLFNGAVEGVSMAKMWNLSIVGAVIFGMFTMTMIYRYLGQNVSAKMADSVGKSEISYVKEEPEVDINDGIDMDYITRILENEDGGGKISKKEFEKEIRDMVQGYPIEKMVPEIVKQDRITAAFLVAIAKKESNWGKRVPVLDGEDCYNYWGYRGIRARMGTGGHTCFDSLKDAVETVGNRIEYLVSETKRNTPDKMVVWKCGYDCSWDSKTAVRKWINDVDLYFKKLNRG